MFLGAENAQDPPDRADNDGPPKLRGINLADLTMTDQNARVDTDGPDINGPIHGWMTMTDHKAWMNSDGPQFYGVLKCPCLLFVVRHSHVRPCPPLLLCPISVKSVRHCQILHFSVTPFFFIFFVLFSQALNNNHYVLHTLLPNKLEITYQLRHRRHNLTLPRKSGSTTQCDFIIRMLFKDSY